MKQRLQVLCLATLLAAAAAQAQQKPAAKASAPAPAQQAPKAPASPAKPPVPEGVKVDESKEGEGRLAATGWLQLLDRRDWGTAWERSGNLFRKNVPLGAWMDNIPKVRDPLGSFVSREAVGVIYKTTLPGYPDGDYVSVSFVSKFERKDEVKELVTTVKEPDGRWRITGYSAQ